MAFIVGTLPVGIPCSLCCGTVCPKNETEEDVKDKRNLIEIICYYRGFNLTIPEQCTQQVTPFCVPCDALLKKFAHFVWAGNEERCAQVYAQVEERVKQGVVVSGRAKGQAVDGYWADLRVKIAEGWFLCFLN